MQLQINKVEEPICQMIDILKLKMIVELTNVNNVDNRRGVTIEATT